MQDKPFPTGQTKAIEYYENKYFRLKYDVIRDKKFQFFLLTNDDWEITDIKPEVPDEKNNLTSLALFKKNSEPTGEIEVFASLISRDVNPSDWLELWLHKKNAKIINGRRFETKYGRVADYLAVLEEPVETVLLRALSIKDNNSIFTITGRAYERFYNQLAEDFYIAIASFQIAHPTKKAFAEKMLEVLIDNPVKCSFLFPMSWEKREESANNIDSHSVSWYNRKGETVVGTFSFISISKSIEDDMSNLFYKYLSNFTEQGFSIVSDFEILPVENDKNTYQALIHLSNNDNNHFELICRFLKKSNVIIMFALCSFIDEENYDIHIINKRAFEIAVNTFKSL